MNDLQRIQRNIEGCAADALSLRDELNWQGLDEAAKEALILRDQLEQIARELADIKPTDAQPAEWEVLTAKGWEPLQDQSDEQESDEVSTFNLAHYLFLYNRSGYASRAEFSAATGIAPSVLIRLERGETKKPHLKTVARLAKALKVQPLQLDSRFRGES